ASRGSARPRPDAADSAAGGGPPGGRDRSIGRAPRARGAREDRLTRHMLRAWHFIWIAIACAIAGCASEQPMTVARALAPGEFAETILTNGKIVTVDERFGIAQALAVKDGRIVAVGSSA